MSVALISCSNGLGHCKRLVSIYLSLIKNNIKPTLFADKKKINLLSSQFNLRINNFVHFNSNTNIENLINGSSIRWEQKLPDLGKYKVVISDNLPDILLIRPDAIISGSFLWHKVLHNIDKDIKRLHERLLIKFNPIFFSNYLLTPAYIKKFKNNKLVGFNVLNHKVENKTKFKKDLLISFGLGHSNNNTFNNFLKQFVEKKFYLEFDNIWVEKKFYNKKFPENFKMANFKELSLTTIKLAIIRPGIGTITDLLQHNIKMVFVYEKENKEMLHNARILHKLRLGLNTKNDNNFAKIKSFVTNKSYEYKNKFINFNGSEEISKIVKNLI